MKREQPHWAWIETRDGERVECLLERVGANEWQAVPVRDLTYADMRHAHIDLLPAGAKLSFIFADDDDLSH